MFFDIGANIGLWAKANIQFTDKIIAVEASPITFMRLVQNVNNSNIVCLNFAACNNDGKDIPFYQGEADTLSTLNEEWFTSSESRFHNHPHFQIICKTITLDALISEFGVPDLIKIDVEAGEYDCISSLTQKVNLLCFEWASELNAITFKCLDYLLTIGFTEFYLQNGDSYTFRPESDDFYNVDTIKLLLINSVVRLDMGMVWCR